MREPVSISIRPDSTIRLNVKQLIAICSACLAGAFISGVSYMKVTSHIDSPDHPTARQIQNLELRLAVLELKCGSLKGN